MTLFLSFGYPFGYQCPGRNFCIWCFYLYAFVNTSLKVVLELELIWPLYNKITKIWKASMCVKKIWVTWFMLLHCYFLWLYQFQELKIVFVHWVILFVNTTLCNVIGVRIRAYDLCTIILPRSGIFRGERRLLLFLLLQCSL